MQIHILNFVLINISFGDWILISLISFLLLILIVLLNTLKSLVHEIVPPIKKENEKTFIDAIESSLTNAMPIDREEEILLDHNYDGIKELDNHLPPWWVVMFYATIIWAIGYLIYFHFSDSAKLSLDEYNDEMAIAAKEKSVFLEKEGNKVNEETVTLFSDQENLNQGKEIFTTNCTPCHGQSAEGSVGPNLTDIYWLHGGGIKNIFKTVKYGILGKGMTNWETQLTPKQIQQVSSYVWSLQGSNPLNGKEKQGEVYSENTNEIAPDSLKMQTKK